MRIEDYKLGTKVQLASKGGPVMTVTSLISGESKDPTVKTIFTALETQSGGNSVGFAQCTWFNEKNEVKRDWFPIESLVIVND